MTDRRQLEPRPHSVGQARRIVREMLTEAGRDDLSDAVELVVSELVTNALLHAGTAIVLSLAVDEAGALIEVSDGSAHLPTERDYAALAGTGRGLALVHQLCESWGARPTASGKTVWAQVTTDVRAADVAALAGDPRDPVAGHDSVDDDSAPRRAAAPGTVVVELRNVPLLMHLVWHQHAEALMREYLLARLEDDEAVALQEHAMASDALALLYDQIPAPELPGDARRLDDVTELLVSVVEPVPTLPRGWLEVAEGSLHNFRVLDDVLEDAIELSETDALLTTPVQPEMRELRRWICGQVAEQSRGGRPRAWVPPAVTAPTGPLRHMADWDSGPVDRSRKPLVAADDSNRIIAVSDPALELLGYEHPAELVGQRLLVLIPRRFHQAHLAGFTMHLTSGRRPLLDTEMTLPFLRRDGTEVPLRLTVRALSLGGDQRERVFMAELRSAD